jgi:excisionase family DNA binding protein
MEGYLTPLEAADKLNLTVYRVHQLIRGERLPAQKFGRFYLVREEDLALVAVRKPGRPAKEPSTVTKDVKAGKRAVKAKKAKKGRAV